MKILHTADWHLGKSFNNYTLLDEQKYILSQFIEIAQNEKPEVILIAGDIYDRSVPPAEAVRLFDEVMSALVLDLRIPVIAIAGNHDSAERINYCNYLLQKQGLHIFGNVQIPIRAVILNDKFGEVYFYPVPYTEPEVLRYFTKEESIRSHEDVMTWLIQSIFEKHPPNKRSVFIGHAFLAGGLESESERQLLVGGAANIPVSLFERFNYSAFGHLHQPQKFLEEKVQYAGSILKYSFSETTHYKKVVLIDLDAAGNIQSKEISLLPQKDVKRVQGKIYQRIFQLNGEYQNVGQDDLLEVSLDNEEVVANAMQIVQKSYPNAMALKWPKLQRNLKESQLTTAQLNKMSEKDLFMDFYTRFTGKNLDKNKELILAQTIKEIKKEEG